MATSLLAFGKKEQESDPIPNTSRLSVTPDADATPRSSNGLNVILMVREHGQQQIIETIEEINFLKDKLGFAERKLQTLQNLVDIAMKYEAK